MREERRRLLPPVIEPVDVRDRHFGKFFFGDALQAAYVHAVHLADRRIVADAEGADAAVFAKEMLVLFGVKAVLGHFLLARQQAKVLGLGGGHPEPVSPADGAVAPVRAHGQVEIGLESNRAAVATAAVGLQHLSPLDLVIVFVIRDRVLLASLVCDVRGIGGGSPFSRLAADQCEKFLILFNVRVALPGNALVSDRSVTVQYPE